MFKVGLPIQRGEEKVASIEQIHAWELEGNYFPFNRDVDSRASISMKTTKP